MENKNIEKIINDALSGAEANAVQELSLDDLNGVAGGVDIPGLSESDKMKLNFALKTLKKKTGVDLDEILNNLPVYYEQIKAKINITIEQLKAYIVAYWGIL